MTSDEEALTGGGWRPKAAAADGEFGGHRPRASALEEKGGHRPRPAADGKKPASGDTAPTPRPPKGGGGISTPRPKPDK